MELVRKEHDDCVVWTAMRGGEAFGFVAIDSTVNGRSCGGLRMMPDVDEDEIRGLARAMTLKYGFLGLPRGGAKAGVRADPEAPRDERLAALVEFGRAIRPLLKPKAFLPAADMGTCASDIRFMLDGVGVKPGRRELAGNSSGYYTAVSAMASVRQAAEVRGLDLARCAAAVEGFGKVGAPLAGLLSREGVKVVAVSTSLGALYNPGGLDVERLVKLAGDTGSGVVGAYSDAQPLDRRWLVELPVDILCPCARHNSIARANAPKVKARVVCGGANNPVTPEARGILESRGILVVPDFVSNCGGVLGGTMEFASMRPPEISAFIDTELAGPIRGILVRAERDGVSPTAVAEDISRTRFRRAKLRAECPTAAGAVFSLGLALYRNGFLPGAPARLLAPAYFRRLLT